MRVKNSLINSISNMFIVLFTLIPNFFLRKVFLDVFGDEYLGLSSLYTNIISLLSIVELGIGPAIIFSLYKPYAEHDIKKVKAYLRYYSLFYKIIGIVILIVGIIISPAVINLIDAQISTNKAYLYFFLFLINTFITYMFSYKLCLLNVAQEQYKVTISTGITKVIIILVQIVSLRIVPNYSIYLLIDIVINLAFYIGINTYIDNKFVYLKGVKGYLTDAEKNSLFINVKAMFLHKIGGLVVNSTDNLVITKFINLTTVGKFNSYNMVLLAAKNLVSRGIQGITASIGNLLVSSDKEIAYEVHKKLFFISFWVVSFICITLYNTLTQFVLIWLGDGQILDQLTVSVLIVNLYFSLMRASVERFKEAAGKFHEDRYAPLFESLINLTSSIILVKYMGLPGVFIGTLISNLTVIFWVKPKIVYKYVFGVKLIEYFKMYFKYLCVALVLVGVTGYLTTPFKYSESFVYFIVNCLINVIVINMVYLFLFWRKDEFKYFKNIFLKIINVLLKKAVF